MKKNDKKNEKYDIFISYRRDGGYETAQLLYDSLKQLGYRVSFDMETLRGGKFNEQLYGRIEQCSDVLAIMSKNSLALRENREDDWFRLEIAHALKHGKNIVPVFLRDFKFPDKKTLPPDIAEIVDFNGVVAAQEHYDSTVKKISEKFNAKPRRSKWKIIGLALFLLLAVSGIGIWKNFDTLFPYPFTAEQKNEVNAWVGQMGMLCASYNDYISAASDFLNSVRLSMDSGSRRSYDDAVPLFEHRVKIAKQKFDAAAIEIKQLLGRPNCMPTDVAGALMFIESCAMDFVGAEETVRYLEHIADPAFPCAKHNRYKALELKVNDRKLQVEIFAYSVMGVFYKVSQSSLEEFMKMAREWTHIPHLGEANEWLKDEKAIENKLEVLLNRYAETVGELQTILGDQTAALAKDEIDFNALLTNIGSTPEQSEKMLDAMNYCTLLQNDENPTEAKFKSYREKLVEAGMSAGQADSMVLKLREMIALRQKLLKTNEAIEEKKDKAAQKFAPLDTDEVGTLWGKTLRFMSLKMPDEAKKCISVLRRKSVADFPPAALDAAEAFFFSKVDLPFKEGLLVCMFEPPATTHAIYKIGDIITAVDGIACKKFEDYRAKAGRSYTIYRRDANGVFKQMVLTMPEGQPRVALVNIKEYL